MWGFSYSKILELEEELKVVGNNMKSLEISEQEVTLFSALPLDGGGDTVCGEASLMHALPRLNPINLRQPPSQYPWMCSPPVWEVDRTDLLWSMQS